MLALLHIPKTGGTSLWQMLVAAGARLAHINRPSEAEAFASLPAAEREAFDVASGHMPQGLHTFVPRVRYVTMLREPVARIVSSYLHIARTPKHPIYPEIAAGLSFERFALEHTVVDNAMTRRLAVYDWCSDWWNAVPHGGLTNSHFSAAFNFLGRCAAVGLFENYEQDARRLAAVGGWRLPDPLAHLNTSADYLAVPASLRSRIEQQNGMDSELYAAATRIATGR